jgi:hypothetical protein
MSNSRYVIYSLDGGLYIGHGHHNSKWAPIFRWNVGYHDATIFPDKVTAETELAKIKGHCTTAYMRKIL